MFSDKDKEIFKLFYTDEEISRMTRADWLRFKIESFWYNFSEMFLTLKESDSRWMKKNA